MNPAGPDDPPTIDNRTHNQGAEVAHKFRNIIENEADLLDWNMALFLAVDQAVRGDTIEVQAATRRAVALARRIGADDRRIRNFNTTALYRAMTRAIATLPSSEPIDHQETLQRSLGELGIEISAAR